MGFLANPANRTVETSSKTHGLLRAPSPGFTPYLHHHFLRGNSKKPSTRGSTQLNILNLAPENRPPKPQKGV